MESEDTGRIEAVEKPSKERFIIIAILVVLAIVAVFLVTQRYINHAYDNDYPDEEIIKCMANRTILLTSPGCGHCALQKELLGDYLELFNEISCVDNPMLCLSYGITGVPTWVVNNETYAGRKSWDELREITGC